MKRPYEMEETKKEYVPGRYPEIEQEDTGCGREHRCPTCGKSFYILSADSWAFKNIKSRGGGHRYFCTWTCKNAFNRYQEYKRKTTRKRYMDD